MKYFLFLLYYLLFNIYFQLVWERNNVNMSTYLIAGGDLRNIHIANLLTEKNEVLTIGFDNTEQFKNEIQAYQNLSQIQKEIDYLVLPLPVTVDNVTLNTPLFCGKLLLDDILNIRAKTIFGGMLNDKVKLLCEHKNIYIEDYFKREELAIYNAIPTAEGALQIAMEELPTTIFGTKCFITGYGRVAKVLSKLLSALGADVTVAARKHSDLAWADMNGAMTIHIDKIKEYINDFSLIINTIPAKIFNRDILSSVNKDVLIIDLASKPGGVEFEDAKKLNLKVIWALSLPGKVAPYTSGKIIFNTINNIIDEM